MSDAALTALQQNGISPIQTRQNILLNGFRTVTPIISTILKKTGKSSSTDTGTVLANINKIQSLILKELVGKGIKIEEAQYIAVNRTSIELVCNAYLNEIEIDFIEATSFAIELLTFDDIYCETITQELTDSEQSNQFMATASLSAVITKHLINLRGDSEQAVDLLHEIVELVDIKLDELHSDFIEYGQEPFIRKTLLEQAAAILDATLVNYKAQRVDIDTVIEKFKDFYNCHIEAITIAAKLKSE